LENYTQNCPKKAKKVLDYIEYQGNIWCKKICGRAIDDRDELRYDEYLEYLGKRKIELDAFFEKREKESIKYHEGKMKDYEKRLEWGGDSPAHKRVFNDAKEFVKNKAAWYFYVLRENKIELSEFVPTYFALGHIDEIMEILIKLVELANNSGDSIRNDFLTCEWIIWLGRCYFFKGNIDKAIENFEDAITREEVLSDIKTELCWLYIYKGQFRQAADVFFQEEVMARKGENYLIYWTYARAAVLYRFAKDLYKFRALAKKGWEGACKYDKENNNNQRLLFLCDVFGPEDTVDYIIEEGGIEMIESSLVSRFCSFSKCEQVVIRCFILMGELPNIFNELKKMVLEFGPAILEKDRKLIGEQKYQNQVNFIQKLSID
jgi:tetratricopeptide (TPR) repeat protein